MRNRLLLFGCTGALYSIVLMYTDVSDCIMKVHAGMCVCASAIICGLGGESWRLITLPTKLPEYTNSYHKGSAVVKV